MHDHDHENSEEDETPEEDEGDEPGGLDRTWPGPDDDESDDAASVDAAGIGARGDRTPERIRADLEGLPEDSGEPETLPAQPAELVARLDRITRRMVRSTWSAPIPRPEDMRAYRELLPDAPERIFRMAECRTVDASKRLDRLVDAEIAQAKSDRRMATAFLLLFTVASVVFFSLGNSIAGGILLGIPVLAVIKTMWSTPIGSTARRAQQPGQQPRRQQDQDNDSEDK